MILEKKYYSSFSSILLAFFFLGFMSTMNDILSPYLKASYDLSYFQAMLVQFAFFSAYALLSIPLAKLLSNVTYRTGLMLGVLITGVGCLLFIPAAVVNIYYVFLLALFVIAAGVVIIQLTCNPYASSLGSEKSASQRMLIMQLMGSLATIIAPTFGAMMLYDSPLATAQEKSLMSVNQLAEYNETISEVVQKPYLLLAITMLIVAFIITRIPTFKDNSDTNSALSQHTPIKPTELMRKYPYVMYGVIAIFVYVGIEVTLGSFMINYITHEEGLGITPKEAGGLISIHYSTMWIGRFAGIFFLMKVNTEKLLATFSSIAIIMMAFVTWGAGSISVYMLIASGMANSIMFASIFTLLARGLGSYIMTASGLVGVAIVGGAILPPIQGIMADITTVQSSYFVPFLAYFYILWFAIKGCKIGLAENSYERKLVLEQEKN